MSRLGIRDRGVANDSRDSKRKDKLITGHHILIDIYKGEYEVRGKVYSKVRDEGQQNSQSHVSKWQRLCLHFFFPHYLSFYIVIQFGQGLHIQPVVGQVPYSSSFFFSFFFSLVKTFRSIRNFFQNNIYFQTILLVNIVSKLFMKVTSRV